MQGGRLCVVVDIFEWKIMDGPVSHGSRRTVKGRGLAARTEAPEGGAGSKERRKEASAFRCLIVTDIVGKAELGRHDIGPGVFPVGVEEAAGWQSLRAVTPARRDEAGYSIERWSRPRQRHEEYFRPVIRMSREVHPL